MATSLPEPWETSLALSSVTAQSQPRSTSQGCQSRFRDYSNNDIEDISEESRYPQISLNVYWNDTWYAIKKQAYPQSVNCINYVILMCARPCSQVVQKFLVLSSSPVKVFWET